MLALKKREQKMAYYERIFADRDFVHDITGVLENQMKINLRLSGQRIDIDSLAYRVSRQFRISVGELFSRSRWQNVVQARAVLFWIGIRELGYSGAKVPRYLKVTNSCVTRIVASDTKPPVEALIQNLSTPRTKISLIGLNYLHERTLIF